MLLFNIYTHIQNHRHVMKHVIVLWSTCTYMFPVFIIFFFLLYFIDVHRAECIKVDLIFWHKYCVVYLHKYNLNKGKVRRMATMFLSQCVMKEIFFLNKFELFLIYYFNSVKAPLHWARAPLVWISAHRSSLSLKAHAIFFFVSQKIWKRLSLSE